MAIGQTELLRFLRRFARNEYRFGKASATELGEIIAAIRDQYTPKQRSIISIEGRNLRDLENEIVEELKFREKSVFTEPTSLSPKELLKRSDRRFKDDSVSEQKKFIRRVANIIPTKKTPGIVTKKMPKEKLITTSDKIIDELRSVPRNPVKAMRRTLNKITSYGKTDKERSFSDYLHKETKGTPDAIKLLQPGSKLYIETIKKYKEKYTKDTGIKI